MADGVTRSPARPCSRDGDILYYGRLEHDLTAFVPCFLLFKCLVPYFRMFIFVVFLRLCSSQLLLPASTHFMVLRLCSSQLLLSARIMRISEYVFVLLVSSVSCLISAFLCFRWVEFFFSYLSRDVFRCALVPGTLALDLPTLIYSRLFVFLCLTVTT